MPLIALLLTSLAHAETPIVVFHVDPGASRALPTGWGGELTVKAEFPVWFFVMRTIYALGEMKSGELGPDDFLEGAPPWSPQYVFFLERGFDPEGPVEWGGGAGVRVRPLSYTRTIVPGVGGPWIDLNGRYGTRGWGVDSALGWDLRVSPAFAIGPSVGVVWDGEVRFIGSISFSFSVNAESVGREVTIGE